MPKFQVLHTKHRLVSTMSLIEPFPSHFEMAYEYSEFFEKEFPQNERLDHSPTS